MNRDMTTTEIEASEKALYDQKPKAANIDGLLADDSQLENALLGSGVYDLIRMLEAAVKPCIANGDSIYSSDHKDVMTIADRACDLVEALHNELHTEALRINAELGL